MAAVEVKITGAKEMERVLVELGGQVAGRLGDAAIRAASKPVIEEIVRLAPKDTGDYSKAITFVIERKRRGDNERKGRIGVRRPEYRLLHLLEFGTSKMPAKPHFRSALESKFNDYLKVMAENLGRGINREVRKLNRQGR